MGAASSTSGQPPPEKLSDFKNLAIAPENYCIPEVPQKRSPTDRAFIIVFAVCLLLLFILLGYTLSNSDIRRTKGYDYCGNICGFKNEHVEGINCSGKDMTYKPILTESAEYQSTDVYIKKMICTDEIPKEFSEELAKAGYVKNVSLPRIEEPAYGNEDSDDDSPEVNLPSAHTDNENPLLNIVEKKTESFDGLIWTLVLLMVISIGLCLTMLVLFRYATAVVVWASIVGCYIILVVVALYAWFSSSETLVALFWTAVLIIVTAVLIRVFKRIPLVIALFLEATKAIFSMPLIILQPFLTFIAIVSTFILTLITSIQMHSGGGVLTEVSPGMYAYQLNVVMSFTIFYNVFMAAWCLNLIWGCEIMVVSGSISTWYFARDKTFMGSPIRDSWAILMRFHLGSAAFGSLLITAVEVIRAMLKSLARNARTRCLVESCMGVLESFLIYITRNAYIEIAMHGESFFKSGQRAVRLLFANLRDMMAVNSVANFVTFMAKLQVVLLTILIAVFIVEDESDSFILVTCTLSGVIAVLLAHGVFGLYQTAIDTIFLCYCEDCSTNDGMNRPYYMSTDLMLYFDESKGVMDIKKEPEGDLL